MIGNRLAAMLWMRNSVWTSNENKVSAMITLKLGNSCGRPLRTLYAESAMSCGRRRNKETSLCVYDMIRKVHTWNHKLFTILLSTNSGRIHIMPKMIDNSVTIQPPTTTPTPGLWPNIQFKNSRMNGRSAHSNKTMLKPKKPPFRRQHWKIRFNRFDSLQKKTENY